MGGWAVAQSPILVTTITLDRLRERGYEAMLELYEKIAPHLNEPLYTRPVREFIPIFIGSGVRGSPCQLITGRAVYSISCCIYFSAFNFFCVSSILGFIAIDFLYASIAFSLSPFAV